MNRLYPFGRADPVLGVLLFILDAALEITRLETRAYRIRYRRKCLKGAYRTLRPGRMTPLWNDLRAQLRPHLRKYGTQVNLGRLVGLPRQQINAFVTRGTRMPDAERTLRFLAWLIAERQRAARERRRRQVNP